MRSEAWVRSDRAPWSQAYACPVSAGLFSSPPIMLGRRGTALVPDASSDTSDVSRSGDRRDAWDAPGRIWRSCPPAGGRAVAPLGFGLTVLGVQMCAHSRTAPPSDGSLSEALDSRIATRIFRDIEEPQGTPSVASETYPRSDTSLQPPRPDSRPDPRRLVGPTIHPDLRRIQPQCRRSARHPRSDAAKNRILPRPDSDRSR